ncbi:nucleotidyltransferase domain-containing protein [Herbiconiux sp.]|uniref:nucleotidyltransferase domain-containing protein n=1 Tax=Herbiconiux sp. TaxID=1871186 RepID=UPI0025B92BBB|nr:nucleotidyltransferase domain-containing protein [Herbiconiux sp.]
MRLQSPFGVVTSAVDGDVLAVLARSESGFTVTELHAAIRGRSSEGVRNALSRLVGEGIVRREPVGRNALYTLNRDHLAAPAIVQLAGLGDLFRERLRGELGGWSEPPVFAALFGSAARGAMRTDSDIDVLLVRGADPTAVWELQVAEITRRIHGWTGNDPRLIDFSAAELRGAAAHEPLVASVLDEGITLVGDRLAFRALVSTP